MRLLQQKIFKLAVAILFSLIWLGLVIHLRYPQYLVGLIPMLDFDAYYFLAKATLSGAHPYQVDHMQTLGPPSVIIPFLPFALLPQALARGLMTLINLSSLWAIAVIISRQIALKHSYFVGPLLALALILPFPTRFSIEQGQPLLLAAFLVTVLITGTVRSRQGIVAAFLTLLKTNFLLLLVPLLKTKAFWWALGGLLSLILVSLPIIRPRYYIDFIQTSFVSTVAQPAALDNPDYYNQSLKSTLARLQLAQLYPLVILLLILFGVFYLLKTQDLFSGLLLSLLLSPVVWQHYLVIVYPLLLLAFFNHRHQWKHLVILSFLTLLLTLHAPQLHLLPLTPATALFASHYFIGLVGLFIWHLATRHPATIGK
jgi:hypothetical protein